MAAERAGLMQLELFRYRDSEMSEYIWFWVEAGDGEAVSPFFDNKEDALYWGREMIEVLRKANSHWIMKNES